MSKYIYNPNLKGKHRAFNQEMFNKYDIPARKIVKEKLGEFVIDNPDEFKQDLVITDENCKYKYIEIQVCINWINDKYPYDKVYLHERKSCYGEDTLFITLNKDMTRAQIFSSKGLGDMNLRRIKKYSREYVYDIPWHRVLPVLIDELDTSVINLY